MLEFCVQDELLENSPSSKKKIGDVFCPFRFIQHLVLTALGRYVPNVNRKTREVLWAFSLPWTRAQSLNGSGIPGHIVTAVHNVGGTETSQIIIHLKLICPVVWIIVLGSQSLLEKTHLHFPFLSGCLKAFGDSTQSDLRLRINLPHLSPTLLHSQLVSKWR